MPSKFVHDYEFLLQGGIPQQITLEPEAGDSINFGDREITIFQSAKPGPTGKLPAMNSTIYVEKVLWIKHWEREVVETPKEVYDELAKFVSVGPRRPQ